MTEARIRLAIGIATVALALSLLWLAVSGIRLLGAPSLHSEAALALLEYADLQADQRDRYIADKQGDAIYLWPRDGLPVAGNGAGLARDIERYLSTTWSREFQQLRPDNRDNLVRHAIPSLSERLLRRVDDGSVFDQRAIRDFGDAGGARRHVIAADYVETTRYNWLSYDKTLTALVAKPESNGRSLAWFASVTDASNNTRALTTLGWPFSAFLLSSMLLLGAIVQLYIAQRRKHAELLEGQVRERTAELRHHQADVASIAQEIAGATDEESAVLAHSKVATHQMSVAIEDVTARIHDIQHLAESARSKASVGTDSLAATDSSIARIDANTVRIQGIVDVSTKIADEIRLLALNAAIEAARAGDKGRGFAVVADEIKKLADRSAQSAARIAELIGENTASVRQGNEVVHANAELFQQIIAHVEEVFARITDLSTSMTEQSQTVREIARSAEEISTVSADNALAARRLSDMASGQAA